MDGHIFISQGIGTQGAEISADRVLSQLDSSFDKIVLHFNTPGGDVFEGFKMYNGIQNFKANTGKKVVGIVESYCASIGTLVLGACDEIIMNTVSQLMIHNPFTKVEGDANKFRGVADQLDKIKNLLIGVYEKRTGLPKEELWALYDKETWLNASEAKKMGFADEVQDAIKAVATINIENFMQDSKFQQMASAFKNLIGLTKIKNQISETLSDNRVIVVMADEGEDWTGKQVVLEDGTPLEDGAHTLVSGKTITVAGGVVTEKADAAPQQEAKPNEEMENKIKELEAQLAEAKAALETSQTQAQASEKKAVTAEANTIKIQNRLTKIEQDFIALQEEAKKTVGDSTPPPVGPVIKNAVGTGNVKDYDPMGEEALKYYKNRKLINED